MNYIPLKRDDFDKSFKFEKQSYLCYSPKKLKEITADKKPEIKGLARISSKSTDSRLILGSKQMAVYETSKDSMIYRNIGYVPVGENEYIAVQDNMVPFAVIMSTMTTATALVCMMLLHPALPDDLPVDPADSSFTITADNPQFNPLPPVDPNIEDCDDSTVMKLSDDSKAAPKGGGKVAINYQTNANLDLTTGEIRMDFKNPNTSSHDSVVGLYVVSGGEEYQIAESGRIPAGKQLKTMDLTADKKLFGGEGKYKAEYRVHYYDPVTGERALAEANIGDITLIVRKN